MSEKFTEVQPGYFVGSKQVKQLQSFGEVYEGFVKNENQERQDCFVKVIRISDEKKKFEREIEVLRNTQHPNIVRTLQILKIGKTIYIFKERDDSIWTWEQMCQNLRQNRQFAIEDGQLLRMAAQLVDCLDYLDINDIVHRDIRPQNIIVKRGTEIPKIFDFGQSKIQDEEEIEGTNKFGQYDFQSPQFIDTDKEAEYLDYTKNDVWSLGMTLYYLGEKEFPWRREIQLHEYENVHNDIKKNGIRFQYIINPELRKLISKMLTYSQDDRPYARELLEEFPNLKQYSLHQISTKLRQLFFLTKKIDSAFDRNEINSELLELMFNHLLRYFTSHKQSIVKGSPIENIYQNLLYYQLKNNKKLLSKRQLDTKTAETLMFYYQLLNNKAQTDDEQNQVTLFLQCLNLDQIEDDELLLQVQNLNEIIKLQ